MKTAALPYGVRSMISPLRRVLLKHARDAYRDQDTVSGEWHRLGYHGAPDFARAIAEYDAFVAILQREVPGLEFLAADAATTLDSIYAYDSVLVTPRGVILCRMGKELRRPESAITAAYLEREVQPARVRLGRAFPALGGEGTER